MNTRYGRRLCIEKVDHNTVESAKGATNNRDTNFTLNT